MPTRLPGRRAAHRGGALNTDEKQKIGNWFIEGFSVIEVYERCIDHGIDPPVEHALYRILNSEPIQQGLRARRAAEAGSRIAQIAERTRSRNLLLAKIEATVEARSEEYAGFVPGGDQGLVVLSDKKTVMVEKIADKAIYETFDTYKTDTGIIEQWRGVLNDQDNSDDRLRKNLRTSEEHRLRMEAMAQQMEINESQQEIAEIELDQARAMADERKRRSEQSQDGAAQGDDTLPDNHRTYE